MNAIFTSLADPHPNGMSENSPRFQPSVRLRGSAPRFNSSSPFEISNVKFEIQFFSALCASLRTSTLSAVKSLSPARCLLAILPLVLLTACSEKNESSSQSAPQKPKEEESRIRQGTNNETIIKLDADTQKLMGLQTAALEPAEINKEIKAFGRVLDPSPLASLTAELATARTASAASQAELQRLKTLAAQTNASARALEAAQAAAARDSAQVESARLRLLAGWGTAIAERQDLPSLVQSLGKLDAVLIQLNLHPDQTLKDLPSTARVFTGTTESDPVEAKFLSLAPAVDPQLQGQALLFLVSPNPSRLAPGASVTGLIALPGEKQAGAALPRDAIVRHNGAAWVYVQAAADEFHRTEVHLDTPLANGWFIQAELKPGDKVATAGAQQLLSEEAKE